MKTITVTDREFNILARAVSVQNDILNDTVLDQISAINLYPMEPIAVTPEQLTTLRNEINNIVDDLMAIRALMVKLGLQYNEQGYSV